MWMSERDFALLLARNPTLRVQQIQRKPSTPQCRQFPKKLDFDSDAERRYYCKVIAPALKDGSISKVTLHKTFELLPAAENNGQKYRAIRYSPDFFIEYESGKICVVEVKGRKIKKLRPDYPIRRLLFITTFCNPNQWNFIEVYDDEI